MHYTFFNRLRIRLREVRIYLEKVPARSITRSPTHIIHSDRGLGTLCAIFHAPQAIKKSERI